MRYSTFVSSGPVCVCLTHIRPSLPEKPPQGTDPLRLEFNDLKKI